MEQGKADKFPHQSGIHEIESLAFALESLVTSLTYSESERDHFEALAHHDALTGLSNRVALRQHLNSLQMSDQSYVCFYLDLDGFKAVNDTHGHAIGDALLIELANRLRVIDIEGLYSVRLSGDEFFLLFPLDNRTSEQLRACGAHVIESLSRPFVLDGVTISVGVSIGASLWDPPTPPHVAIEQADQALYLSKENGKNQITLDPSLNK